MCMYTESQKSAHFDSRLDDFFGLLGSFCLALSLVGEAGGSSMTTFTSSLVLEASSVALDSPLLTGGLVGGGDTTESDPGPSVSSKTRLLALLVRAGFGRDLVTCSSLGPIGSSLTTPKSTENRNNMQ